MSVGKRLCSRERWVEACQGTDLTRLYPYGDGKVPSADVCNIARGNTFQRGATGSNEEFYDVVDYLSTNFSPSSPSIKINVNKASAKDLETALRLPEKQATAIIQQRQDKGDFKSLEELQKVPGIDAKKIEANKKRLSF